MHCSRKHYRPDSVLSGMGVNAEVTINEVIVGVTSEKKKYLQEQNQSRLGLLTVIS